MHHSKFEVYHEYVSITHVLKREDFVGFLSTQTCITYLTNLPSLFLVCVDSPIHTSYPREKLSNLLLKNKTKENPPEHRKHF